MSEPKSTKKAHRARCLALCKAQLLCRVRRERGIYLVSFAGGEVPAFWLALLRLLAAAGVIFITVWSWTRYSDSLGYRVSTLTGWGLIITALYFLFASIGFFLAVAAAGRCRRVFGKAARCDCRNERAKEARPFGATAASAAASADSSAPPLSARSKAAKDSIRDVPWLAAAPADTALAVTPTPPFRPLERQWTIDNYPPVPPENADLRLLRFLQKFDGVWRGVVIVLWEFATIEVVITILFWAGGGALGLLDFNGRTTSQVVSSALQHAMLPFLLVDLALNRMPVLPAHVLYLLLLYFAYILVNVAYTVSTEPVYKNITWANGTSYGVAIAGGAILALAFALSWFLAEVKRRT